MEPIHVKNIAAPALLRIATDGLACYDARTWLTSEGRDLKSAWRDLDRLAWYDYLIAELLDALHVSQDDRDNLDAALEPYETARAVAHAAWRMETQPAAIEKGAKINALTDEYLKTRREQGDTTVSLTADPVYQKFMFDQGEVWREYHRNTRDADTRRDSKLNEIDADQLAYLKTILVVDD